jgi:hypothetical protein
MKGRRGEEEKRGRGASSDEATEAKGGGEWESGVLLRPASGGIRNDMLNR